MASLLRHPQCFPLTSPFSADVFSSASAHPPHSQAFLSLPLPKSPLSSPLCHALKSKSRRPSLLFHFSCACSATSTPFVETQSTANDGDVAPVEKEEEEEEFSRTRLIAQNIPWTCTAEDVRSLFEKHGTVVEVELSMHNKTMNRNRGLAFVEMGSAEEALTALNSLESSEFEGRVLKVNYAKLRKKKSPPPAQPRPIATFNLFVANLSYEARAKDLREFFDSGSGRVASAEVIFHDNPRKSSGYGFVSFISKKDAEAALTTFQGKDFMGRPLRVARSKQFLKLQTKESLRSNDASDELIPDAEQVHEAV
ncbi:28 kDa ribonucleoprotein, chloroplastic [Rhodamnia argentea]|uniref:28 kDa ribonucleoprotein, chloroplastic n=1 Tax=Rhodamnia argentea TaxID=178133 RepID=A0A8B8P455_9MYRT|nr:28 kDa ribonucleoprotein, chloroplastic [Rhodamnia argentea]